jgi:hypothetical protein
MCVTFVAQTPYTEECEAFLCPPPTVVTALWHPARCRRTQRHGAAVSPLTRDSSLAAPPNFEEFMTVI